MYRISSYEQAASLWIFDLIDNHEIIIIERPKREEEYIDKDRVRIHIQKTDEYEREITIQEIS